MAKRYLCEGLGKNPQIPVLAMFDPREYKAAQNIKVLPSRLPRSGMAFSPKLPGSWALLILMATSFSWGLAD
jgi:hypothetical protein